MALIAGEGEGPERTTAVIGEGAGWERKELYVDARDISSETGDEEGSVLPPEEYKKLLIERGKERLEEYKAVKLFEGEVDTSHMFVYGKDFFLGDTVQLVNEYGIEATSVVEELVISHNANGYRVVPTFNEVN